MLSTIVIIGLAILVVALALQCWALHRDNRSTCDTLVQAIQLNGDLAMDAAQKGHDLHQALSDQLTLELDNAGLRETVTNMGISIELLADELEETRIAYAKRQLGGTILELDCL